MEIHFDLTLIKYVISSYPLSNVDLIWRLMEILVFHYRGVSKQYRIYRILHISEIACTILLFLFQFWSLLKIDTMPNKVK